MGACVVMNAEGACLFLNIDANPSQSIDEILGIIFLTIISETCKVKNICSCAVKITFPCLYLEFPFFPGHVPHKKKDIPNTPKSRCSSMRIREKKLLVNEQLQRLKSQPLDTTVTHTPAGELRAQMNLYICIKRYLHTKGTVSIYYMGRYMHK